MGSLKNLYGPKIFREVIHIYGTSSQICKDMIAGKKISGLIKDSIRKKGSSYRIKEKKDLYKECKLAEEFLNDEKTGSVSL